MPSKRPVPRARAIDHALKLAGEGWSGEAIDHALGLRTSGEGREVVDLAEDVIVAIVRDLFGSATRVEHSMRLAPLTTHGIQRRGGFTGNLVYALVLARPRRRLILRVNRGLRDDVYDRERENYALVRDATGIPGPEILRIDRSQRLAPSEYMVMEHVEGELGSYLAHPDNPDVSGTEKHRIRAATGDFHAALHIRSHPAGAATSEARRLLFGLHRLADAAPSFSAGPDAAELRACMTAFASAPALRSDTDSLCFMDGELLFARRGDHWAPAYVCDLEWVGYRDRYSDLLSALCLSVPLWALPSPGVSRHALDAAQVDPFFRTYRQQHDVDWARLAAIVPYHQLALWGHALADQPDAAARSALWALRGDLVRALMRHVQR